VGGGLSEALGVIVRCEVNFSVGQQQWTGGVSQEMATTADQGTNVLEGVWLNDKIPLIPSSEILKSIGIGMFNP
jgi:hypothetical protein